MARQFPSDLIDQARTVQTAWSQISQTMALGDLTLPKFSTNIDEAIELDSQITSLETQLTHLRNQRQASYASIWEKMKRVRAGVKAIYGDDSSQYDMIGGTRASERKSPTRQPTAVPVP